MNETTRSSRLTARLVGMLVLAAFLAYGVGSMIATTVAATPDSRSRAPAEAPYSRLAS